MAARLEPDEIQALLQLYTAGTITQSTLLEQLEAGEVLGDDFDVEEELEGTQNGGMIEMDQPNPRRGKPCRRNQLSRKIKMLCPD